MNNIITNFNQIVELAQGAGVPLGKRRGILREYLQTKFLSLAYAKSQAKKLSFIGGTSLRILRGIDRFSEDLDFDNLGLSEGQLNQLISAVVEELRREHIDVALSAKLREGITYYTLRFPELLSGLHITSDPREKLMIKIDYSRQWKGQKTEVVLMAKYGFVEQVITNPLSQILVQKLAAYVTRDKTQPRDMYDIVWLYGLGVMPDRAFMNINHMEDIIVRAKTKFDSEGASEIIARRLRPFLFDERNIRKISLLGDVLEQLK